MYHHRRPRARRVRDPTGGLAHRDGESHQPGHRQDCVPAQHDVSRDKHVPSDRPAGRSRRPHSLLCHRQLHRPYHGHADYFARHSNCYRLDSSGKYIICPYQGCIGSSHGIDALDRAKRHALRNER